MSRGRLQRRECLPTQVDFFRNRNGANVGINVEKKDWTVFPFLLQLILLTHLHTRPSI
jgi:hypothetical protein